VDSPAFLLFSGGVVVKGYSCPNAGWGYPFSLRGWKGVSLWNIATVAQTGASATGFAENASKDTATAQPNVLITYL